MITAGICDQQNGELGVSLHSSNPDPVMSALGLGRAKTVSMGVGFESKRRMASGHDRSDQRLDPDNVHDPRQIIGEDREGHLGGHLWERFGQEVRRPHACFQLRGPHRPARDRAQCAVVRTGNRRHDLALCLLEPPRRRSGTSAAVPTGALLMTGRYLILCAANYAADGFTLTRFRDCWEASISEP